MATRPGFVGDAEVVELWFDPRLLPFEQLLQGAVGSRCAERVWTTTPAQQVAAQKLLGSRALTLAGAVRADQEPKYYLQQTAWRHVPMTALQAARANAMLAPGRSGKERLEELLSPRQLAMYGAVQQRPDGRWPELVGVELLPACEAFRQAAGRKQ